MPLRPFPHALSIGTDIIHVKRVADILSRANPKPHHQERFLRRFLTPREQREFHDRFDHLSSVSDNELHIISKHLAGR